MTKKHFIALGDTIRQHNAKYPAERRGVPFQSVHLAALADFCQSQNPRFNRQRWLDYIDGKCGKNGGVK